MKYYVYSHYFSYVSCKAFTVNKISLNELSINVGGIYFLPYDPPSNLDLLYDSYRYALHYPLTFNHYCSNQ